MLKKIIFFNIIGCSAPQLFIGPAIQGIVYWIKGEAHKYYEEDADVVYRATKHALNDLNLPISKDEITNKRYVIDAGEDNRFHIKIETTDKDLTRLNIRVNFMGDKDYAELIYKKVDENINTIHYNEQGVPSRKNRFRQNF